jgi:ubiquinone/menaquinone biosynthesis C-methylase UbiE
MATRSLSHEEARAFYDRFGKKQDLQRFYEDPAIDRLLRHAELSSAKTVVELGCGTGRLAERLFGEELSADASYFGFDISTTMIELARSRLDAWAGRASVELTDGSPKLPLEDGCCDRFLCTYVLDLLSEEETALVLAEARRLLAPGGRLCVVSLTHGQASLARMVSRVWAKVHELRPQLVGGCRPVELTSLLGSSWDLLHRDVVCAFGVCSEVVVAA